MLHHGVTLGVGRTSFPWGEMAALAVLPNSPSLVHPGKNRLVLLKKRNLLLDKLYHQGIIDSTTSALARFEPVPDKPMLLPQAAPHLLQRFKADFNHQKNDLYTPKNDFKTLLTKSGC